MLAVCQGQNLYIVLLIEIPIDEHQDHDPWLAMPLQDQDTNPLLRHCWVHHHCTTKIFLAAIVTENIIVPLLRYSLWQWDHCFFTITPSSHRSLLHRLNCTSITVSSCCTTTKISLRPWLWLYLDHDYVLMICQDYMILSIIDTPRLRDQDCDCVYI